LYLLVFEGMSDQSLNPAIADEEMNEKEISDEQKELSKKRRYSHIAHQVKKY